MRKSLILNFLFLLTSIFTSKAFASSAYQITSKQDLCTAIQDGGFFQKKLLNDPDSRLAFRNLPGLINRGVCWWHSRFTRAATYLTVFRPDILKKPRPYEVIKILRHIRRRDKVVEITGYRNLYEFSADHKSLIEKELNRWSLIDAFNFSLVNGLRGDSEETPRSLETMMDNLFHLVKERGRIVFQTLQLPGFSAHSWLVVDMQATLDGYEISVVDSNYSDIQQWNYKRGQTSFWYSSREFLPVEGHFVPYANQDWQEEEDRIMGIVKNYCNKEN
jgi:hypothetical protein